MMQNKGADSSSSASASSSTTGATSSQDLQEHEELPSIEISNYLRQTTINSLFFFVTTQHMKYDLKIF